MISHASISTGVIYIGGTEYAIVDSVLDPQPSLGVAKVRSLIAEGVLVATPDEVESAATFTVNLDGWNYFDLNAAGNLTVALGTGLATLAAGDEVHVRIRNATEATVTASFSGAFLTQGGNVLSSLGVAAASSLDLIFSPTFDAAGDPAALALVFPASLPSTGESLYSVAIPAVVEAGEVRSSFFQPGHSGSVVSVKVICSSLIVSAADGCTASVQGEGGAVVESFDLTAVPAFTLAAEGLTVVPANSAFTDSTVLRPMTIAGADVTGGKDLTFLFVLRRS